MKLARRLRAAPIGVTVVALVVASAGPAVAGFTRVERARMAAGFVVAHQAEDGSFAGGFSTIGTAADAVVALVAARRGPDEIAAALDYLEEHVGEADTIGLKAKVVLAAVAGGRDPRDFGGTDLVQQIVDSEQEDGRYGAGTPVLEHTLAVLAVTAAGESTDPPAEPPPSPLDWLATAQCEDGGWQYDEPSGPGDNVHCYNGTESDFFRSETDASGYAIQSLAAAGYELAQLENNPFRFLRRRRDPVKGGWGYDKTFPLTNANSTALAIQAFIAGRRDLPAGAMRALKRLQHGCGDGPPFEGPGFGFAARWEDEDRDGRYRRTPPDIGATVAAIPALMKEPFPVDAAAVTEPAPSAFCP